MLKTKKPLLAGAYFALIVAALLVVIIGQFTSIDLMIIASAILLMLTIGPPFLNHRQHRHTR